MAAKMTKQGVPSLDGPRNGKRPEKPRLYGVCPHPAWVWIYDDFGAPTDYEECVECFTTRRR